MGIGHDPSTQTAAVLIDGRSICSGPNMIHASRLDPKALIQQLAAVRGKLSGRVLFRVLYHERGNPERELLLRLVLEAIGKKAGFQRVIVQSTFDPTYQWRQVVELCSTKKASGVHPETRSESKGVKAYVVSKGLAELLNRGLGCIVVVETIIREDGLTDPIVREMEAAMAKLNRPEGTQVSFLFRADPKGREQLELLVDEGGHTRLGKQLGFDVAILSITPVSE